MHPGQEVIIRSGIQNKTGITKSWEGFLEIILGKVYAGGGIQGDLNKECSPSGVFLVICLLLH